MKKRIGLFMLVILSYGCTSGNMERAVGSIQVIKPQGDKIVVSKVSKQFFYREILANGKLSATQKANLKFAMEGIITSISVREGQHVGDGQELAVLDQQVTRQQLASARLGHQQAMLDYQDQLLRGGYRLADTAKLDVAIKDIARLRSGLSKAELDVEKAKQDISRTHLIAPFPGKIANLKAMPKNSSGAYEYICTLISDEELMVDFLVLEQELPFIRASNRVVVMPFSDEGQHFEGRVQSINPQVDASGMVAVHAQVKNRGGLLLDGMDVQVKVQQRLDDQLVIPKEAVLDRQGRKVVFTLVDSLTKWNYVEIVGENSTHYAIGSGLKEADRVIHEGNFNLSHDKVIRQYTEQ